MRFFLVAAALAWLALPAAAACQWEWLCNGDGACKQMPVCDSVDEVPPPKPDSAPPEMPPLSMRPQKIPGNGTALTCEHIMRKNRTGKWYWREACYCSDPARGTDPTPPFANIVRCDSQ